MLSSLESCRVFLATGATDMRKSIDGLAVIVSECLALSPLSSSLFVFCNRKKDKIKILHWDGTGFWLYYRCCWLSAYPRSAWEQVDPNNSNFGVILGLPLRSYFRCDLSFCPVNVVKPYLFLSVLMAIFLSRFMLLTTTSITLASLVK